MKILVPLLTLILCHPNLFAQKTAADFLSDGLAKVAQKRYVDAIPDFNLYIRGNSDNVLGYYNRGLCKLQLKDYNGAISDMDLALDVKPNHYLANTYRGICNVNLRKLDLAIQDFDRAIRVDPTQTLAYLNRGSALIEHGQYKNAIIDFNKVVELTKDKSELLQSHLALGKCEQLLKNYEAAAKQYNTVLDLVPNNQEAIVGRGLANRYLGNNDKALGDLMQAIARDNENAELFYNRALILANTNKFQQAISDFKTSIDLNPKDYLSYYGLGYCYSELGNFRAASKALDVAVSLENPAFNTENKPVYPVKMTEFRLNELVSKVDQKFPLRPMLDSRAEAYYLRAKAKYSLGQFKECGMDINNALELKPLFPEAYYLRGLLRIKENALKLSVNDFTNALDQNPDLVTAYYLRGLVKQALNDFDGGCLDLSKAGEMGLPNAYKVIQENCSY